MNKITPVLLEAKFRAHKEPKGKGKGETNWKKRKNEPVTHSSLPSP